MILIGGITIIRIKDQAFDDQLFANNSYEIKRNLSNLPKKKELTGLLSLPELFDKTKFTEYGTDSRQILDQMNLEDQQNLEKINQSFNKTFSQLAQNKTNFKNDKQNKASSKQPFSYNFIYPKSQINSQQIFDNSSKKQIRSTGYSTIASNNLIVTNNLNYTSSHDQIFMKSKQSEGNELSIRAGDNTHKVFGQQQNSYFNSYDQFNNENSIFTRKNNISDDSFNQQIQQDGKIQDEEVDHFIDKLAEVRKASQEWLPKKSSKTGVMFYQNQEQLNHQIISKTKLIKTVQRRELYNQLKHLNLPYDLSLQKRVLNFDSPPKKNYFTNPQSFLTTVQADSLQKPQSVFQTIDNLNNSEIIKNNKTRQNFLIQKLAENKQKQNFSKQEILLPHDLSEGTKPHVRSYQKELQKRSEQLKEAFDFQISQFENLKVDEQNQLFEVRPLYEHLQQIKTLDEIEIKFKEQIQGACSQCEGLKGNKTTNFYKSDHQLFDYLLHFCLKHREQTQQIKNLHEVKIFRDKVIQKENDSQSYEKLKSEIKGKLTQLIQQKIIEDEIARRPNYFTKFEEAKKNYLSPYVSNLEKLAFNEASIKESIFRQEKKEINFKNTARKLIWLISKQGDILSKDEFLNFLLLVPSEKEAQSIFFNQIEDLSYIQIKETLIEYLNRNSKEPQLIEDYYKDIVDQLPTSSVLTYEFDPDMKVEFQDHIKQVELSKKQEAFMTLISSIRNKQYFLQNQLKQIFSTRNEQLFEIENGKQIYNGQQGILFAQACNQNNVFANPILVTNPDQSRIDLDNFVVIDQPIDATSQELRIQGIPQEIFFANTKLSDTAFSTILNSLSNEQASQLKSIVLSGLNEFGEQTLNIIKSRVVRLKELRLVGTKIKQMESLNSLLSSFIPDLRLQVLSLSKLDMSTRVIDNLISVLACRSGLKVLDISWNHIPENQISKILLNLNNHYNLRNLNLAFIPIFGDLNPTQLKKDFIQEKVKLSSLFCLKQFIRKSTALQHLNLSGVLQSEFQIIKIVKSINNSKSLLAVHLDQTPLLQTSKKLIDYIEKKLKLKYKVQKNSVQMNLSSVQSKSTKQYLNRYELTLLTKQSTREQLYFDYKQPKTNSEFVIQRTIAHPEMENNKLWKVGDDCYFCNQWQYSFIWQVLENKKIDIVQEQEGSDDDEKAPKQMFQTSQPPKIISTNIDFFMEDNQNFTDIRQIAFNYIKPTQKMTENELLESFLHFVSNEQLEILKDYPETVNQIQKKLKRNDLSLLDSPSNIEDTPVFWAILLEKLKSKQIQFLPPLEHYSSFTKLCHEISQTHGAKTLFIQALYIKPSKSIKFMQFHGGQSIFCVPLPRIDEIALCLAESKDKGEDGPRFIREQSVFRHWQEDTPALLQQAMKTDFQYWKLGKMVKDQQEFKECVRVIERYFVKLKEIYITLISSDNFPYIGWNDFGIFCRQAEIIDEQYSNNFIDVIISGVKAGTGAKTMCRHEFVEVLVRIANSKYRETGKASSFSKALEMLLSSMIQNYKFVKPWQQFRDELLWTREVDTLFKTNYTNVLKVFDALFPKLKTTATGITQCVDLIIRHTNLEMQDREVRACYGMSKSTVIDEINNNAEYDKLRLPEFLEFLGRIAHAKFSSVKTDEPFKIETALEHVLKEVFDVYGLRIKIPEPDLLDAQSSEESLQDFKC